MVDVSAVAEAPKSAKPAAKRAGRPATKAKQPRKPKAKAAAAEKATTEVSAPAEPKAKKPRKSKKATAKTAGRAGGYRLSEYDQYIFDALHASGKSMINSDFLAYIENTKASQGQTVDAEEISTMVTRSLQKLANRRDDIAKVPYEGRGMAYALPEWLNPQKELKAKHKR